LHLIHLQKGSLPSRIII